MTISPPNSGPGFCARAAKRRHEGPAPNSPAAVPGAIAGATPFDLTTLVVASTAEAHTQTARREDEPMRHPPYDGDRVIWDLGCMEDTLGKLACPVCGDGRMFLARDDDGKLID